MSALHESRWHSGTRPSHSSDVKGLFFSVLSRASMATLSNLLFACCIVVGLLACCRVQQANFSITEEDMDAGQVDISYELSARYGLPSDNHTVTSTRNATVKLQIQRYMEVNIMLADPAQNWVDSAGAAGIPYCVCFARM